MTLREIVQVARGDGSEPDWPMQAMFGITGALRSMHQGEPATFEGECAAINALTDAGYLPAGPITAEAVEKFVADNPSLMDLDVPDEVILSWTEADPDD